MSRGEQGEEENGILCLYTDEKADHHGEEHRNENEDPPQNNPTAEIGLPDGCPYFDQLARRFAPSCSRARENAVRFQKKGPHFQTTLSRPCLNTKSDEH